MPTIRDRLWEAWMREILQRVKSDAPVTVTVNVEADGRRQLIIEANYYGEHFYGEK